MRSFFTKKGFNISAIPSKRGYATTLNIEKILQNTFKYTLCFRNSFLLGRDKNRTFILLVIYILIFIFNNFFM